MAKENDKEQWVESFVVYAISYEGRKRLYKVDTQLNFFVHGIFKFMISLFVEVLWNKVDLTWLDSVRERLRDISCRDCENEKTKTKKNNGPFFLSIKLKGGLHLHLVYVYVNDC